MSDDEPRPLTQAVLGDIHMLNLLGDDAADLLGMTQDELQKHINMFHHGGAGGGAGAVAVGGGGLAGGHPSSDLFQSADFFAQHHADGALDEISLRHRVSDLETENARLRNLLEQQSASSAELTRKLNLRDVVVDGLRRSVIQSQAANARSSGGGGGKEGSAAAGSAAGGGGGQAGAAMGQPGSLGFDVVEALEEELAQAVAAQVRLREASEAALRAKLERTERHLKRIIAAKEREIIQLHLQFRQTLVQLRSQHTGDIQTVFEENTRLRRMAAEAEQAALVAAEVQFNARLRAEQMRIEAECEQKVQAKLVEMKYLRECLDTQESAAKQLEETIVGLNRDIDAKTRVLHHVLDVELPHEVGKVRAELQAYLDRESTRGQLDLARAQLELEQLRAGLEEAKKAAMEALRDRDAAQHSLQHLRGELAHKDQALSENRSRINVLNHTVAALERDAEQTNMELNLLRRMQNDADLAAGSMTMGGSVSLGSSPNAGASGIEPELRRQLTLASDDNRALTEETVRLRDDLQKVKDDLRSTASSRAVLADRVAELERHLHEQIASSRAQLEKVEKQLALSVRRAGGADAGASAGADAGAGFGAGGRRATRVNFLPGGDPASGGGGGGNAGGGGGGLTSTGSFRVGSGSFRRGGGGGGATPTGAGRGTGTTVTKPGGKAGGAASVPGEDSATPSDASGSRPSSRTGGGAGGGDDDGATATAGTSVSQTPEPGFHKDNSGGGGGGGAGSSSNREGSGAGGGRNDPFSSIGGWEKSTTDFFNSPGPFSAPSGDGDDGDGDDGGAHNAGPASGRSGSGHGPAISTRTVGIQCQRLLAPDQAQSLRRSATPSAGQLLAVGSGSGAGSGILGRPASASGSRLGAAGGSDLPASGGGGAGGVPENTNVAGGSGSGGRPPSFHAAPTPTGDGRPPTGLGGTAALGVSTGSSGGGAAGSGGSGGRSSSGTGRDSAGTASRGESPAGLTKPAGSGGAGSSGNFGGAAGAAEASGQSTSGRNSASNNNNNDGGAGDDGFGSGVGLNAHSSGSGVGAGGGGGGAATGGESARPRPLDEVEILPDEELLGGDGDCGYGVPSSLEERGINARMRIELVQLRFEVQHMCPPRFAAQAQAVIHNMNTLGPHIYQPAQQQPGGAMFNSHAWTPVEELEIPASAADVVQQNDMFEHELQKRRGFHALLFPHNSRLSRFPYRADSALGIAAGAAGPTALGADASGVLGSDAGSRTGSPHIGGGGGSAGAGGAAGGAAGGSAAGSPTSPGGRSAGGAAASTLGAPAADSRLISLEEYNRMGRNPRGTGTGADPEDDGVARRNRDAARLLAGISGVPPYSAAGGDLDAMRREFIAAAIALSHVPGGLEVLRVPISSLLRPAGNRAFERDDGTLELSHPHTMGSGFRVSAYEPAGRLPATAPNTPRSTTSVRAGWRPPEGYLGVNAVKVPAVTTFTTKSAILQPRPPNALHWNNAASAHSGALPSAAGSAKQQQQAAAAAATNLTLQQVNIDVAAVLADQTFATEQEEQQRAVRERQKRDFSRVMRDRLDPRYQTGQEVAAARPASARIRKMLEK